jgi:hypothetical protein
VRPLQVLELEQGKQRGLDLNLASVGTNERLDAKFCLSGLKNSSICQRCL